MLTVLDVLNKATEFLNSKGIDSARLNAELLLANILNCKRLDLYLMYDKPLKQDELDLFREYLKRRSTFEPFQYIIGKVEFYGLELKISNDVLIPRPETEILVETIINSYNKRRELNILDIGCGSGNISIALGVNLNNANVTGIDISKEAIELAQENTQRHNCSDRVSFIKEDILKVHENEYSGFDIIVSNPPYVSEKDYANVQLEIKNYEPDFAVTDFADGYKFYVKIIYLAQHILKPHGKLFFEIAKGQSEKVKELLKQSNFQNISINKDYREIDRVISGEKI
jgi:release factor glutamine methyltransferase